MDIQRGSRRARHVAANTAANQAAQAQQHTSPTPDDGLRPGHLRPAPPRSRDLHRTPDQRHPESDDEHEMPTVAPRVNPFRLHRSQPHHPMPRQHLGQIRITDGGALLRRSSSPVPSESPVAQGENHDAFVDRLEREGSSVLHQVRQLSARVTARSAGWRSRFGGSVRRHRRRSSSTPPPPPPPSGEEPNVNLNEELSMEIEDYEEMSTEIEEFADTDQTDNAATRGTTTPRLSMPLGSEDDDSSGSDPDLSVLAIARGGGRAGAVAAQGAAGGNTREEQMLLLQQAETLAYEDEVMSQEQYEAEETSIEEQVEEEEEQEDEEEEEEEQEVLVDPASIGLKEISNLGKFTVSSHKPGNGVHELRSDDLKLYWQSDGPQPHKLTVYFIKRVGIRVIRFFVDYQEDESYTPTKIVFRSGTSENNMIPFATMTMENPYGWQDVPISGAGGEPDGNTLVSYVLQMEILENHQNGKDTHLRGIKIYAFDPDSGQQAGGHQRARREEDDEASGRKGAAGTSGDRLSDVARILAESRVHAGEGAFSATDFLREPELR
ncbi:anaphase promoting complex subunit 10 [Cordyceps militaris CM01]|uniref:Anaphase promoting complex subunit 10 n=1 Tax=Cordyceps militaris (strain CM01) TaxID=983644 RepID=G3JRD3_CORMM|nr:anaphase promoting complex subunit 10 [Cordyceps militaris CM01]EGX88483.1 anaphase promoting complex subunit 10 [Cordyceps militaris CM01]